MARILKRPMFRRGGMPSNQGVTAVRPQYMGGGMGGIMSGIIPRPDAGLTPRVGYANGPLPIMYDDGYMSQTSFPVGGIEFYSSPKDYGGKSGLYGDVYTGPDSEKMYDERKFLESALDKVERNESLKPQELFALKKYGGKLPSEIKEGAEQIDIMKTAPINKDLKIFKYNEEGKPEQVGKTKKPLNNNSNLDTKTSGQSDLESLQDYMKMFEAAAAGDPDEARKSKYLELAKFGANLIAQPGGDLVGAVGKAASSSIGGLSKQMAEERGAKRQGKLMGLKAGLDKTDMGEFGKKIKALAKLSGQSEESVAKKFLSGDSDFDKIYLAAAEQAGVEAGEAQKIYLKNIKIMSDKNPSVAARLNKPFPKKNPVEGEYYVLPGGEFTRYVNGEKIKPSEPDFYGDIDKED